MYTAHNFLTSITNMATKPRCTVADEAIHQIHTLPIIMAWFGLAVINIVITECSLKAGHTITPETKSATGKLLM